MHPQINRSNVRTRKGLTALSKSVQMIGKLHLDLFCQDKCLLNHADLKIKLRRSRDAFALKIKEMALHVRKVQLNPAVRMGHVKALEKTSCKYPVRRVEVKVDTVPTGNMNYVQDNMLFGQLFIIRLWNNLPIISKSEYF
jgi:hypothetical protein